MKILVAEYASALGLGGTCELEGRAMLSTLVEELREEWPPCVICYARPQDQGG